MVWEIHCSTPRILQLIINHTDTTKSIHIASWSRKAPAILHVSKSARTQGLTFYKSFCLNTRDCEDESSRAYYNRKSDIVYLSFQQLYFWDIHHRQLFDSLANLLDSEFQIHRLALDLPRDFRKSHFDLEELWGEPAFSRLEGIFIVVTSTVFHPAPSTNSRWPWDPRPDFSIRAASSNGVDQRDREDQAILLASAKQIEASVQAPEATGAISTQSGVSTITRKPVHQYVNPIPSSVRRSP